MRKILYGVEPGQGLLADASPEAVGRSLRDLGCDAVFTHATDPAWVSGLREAGLKVYTAIGIFAGQGLWERFPGSRPITAEGEPAPREEWYEPAIPTHLDLRRARLEQIAAVARSAEFDGLWLDFIRWPARWERPRPKLYESSFDPITLGQFQQDLHIRLPDHLCSPGEQAAWILDHMAQAWYTWRCQQIVSFVAEARKRLSAIRPGALLGIFIVPWTDEDHQDGLIRIVGQDPRLLCPHVDVFSPMTYHRLCGRDPRWPGEVTMWLAHRCQRPVWPIIECLEPPTSYPAEEFMTTAREATRASGGALMCFKADTLLAHQEHLAAWRQL
ncbi:MAG: hypothetical protein Kow0047_22900 [Anaerolineae bacterium]